MSNRANPAKREQRAGGFTLIEVMVVVAILGVLTALSVVTFDVVGKRGALQNAAFELQGTLATARTRAMSRGYPVWVVIYPAAKRRATTGGVGGFATVEDSNSIFARTPSKLYAQTQWLKTSTVVSAVYFLEDYSKKVRFGALKPGQVGLFGAPFSALAVQTCSFCSGTSPARGAIGFFPDGGARFVDGDGNLVAGTNHSLALSGTDGLGQQLFAISGPSGYMAAFSPDRL